MKLKVGDGVMFRNVLGDEPFLSVVTEVYPEGIPSCRKPMVKLQGYSGVVLESFCKLVCPDAAPDLQTQKGGVKDE